jgi:hypothetical protein
MSRRAKFSNAASSDQVKRWKQALATQRRQRRRHRWRTQDASRTNYRPGIPRSPEEKVIISPFFGLP